MHSFFMRFYVVPSGLTVLRIHHDFVNRFASFVASPRMFLVVQRYSSTIASYALSTNFDGCSALLAAIIPKPFSSPSPHNVFNPYTTLLCVLFFRLQSMSSVDMSPRPISPTVDLPRYHRCCGCCYFCSDAAGYTCPVYTCRCAAAVMP